MIKQVQLTGERNWWGDDLVGIQDEQWKVLQAWLGQYGTAFILSGCTLTPNGGNYDIAPGIVCLKDAANEYQYCEFAGATNKPMPSYLVLVKTITTDLYGDGNMKAIKNTFTADWQSTAPLTGDSIQITTGANVTWRTVVQDSSHRFVTDADITAWSNAVSGLATLSAAFAAYTPTWASITGKPTSLITYSGSEVIGNVGAGPDAITATDNVHTISIPNQGSSNYIVAGSMLGLSSSPDLDNDISWIVTDKTASSFKVAVRKYEAVTTNLKFEFAIITL